jgi:hypothetical protein
MKKISSVLVGAVFCLNSVAIVCAESDTNNLDDANTIFNWAEKGYSQHFRRFNDAVSANSRTVTNSPNWLYRYYPEKDNAIGIFNDDVYVAGSPFSETLSNPLKLFSTTKALSLIARSNNEKIRKLSTYQSGIFDQSAAEIVSYDSQSKLFFVTNAASNSIDVLTLNGKLRSISLAPYGGGVNSVSAYGGNIAVAVQAENKQSKGTVEFFTHEGVHLKTVKAGALPDMVTFSKNGKIVMSANEGEPSDDYTNDPNGSVTIIDLSNGIENATGTTIDFSSVTWSATGMKFYSNDKAADVEPEYIAINENSTKAYVTLQENNGVAVVDISSKTIEKIIPLGFKDFSVQGNEIDANNNGDITLINVNALGMYQPDSIAVYTVYGEDFFVTANEGDDREYAAYEEETKASSLAIDPSLDTTGLSATVRVTPELGDIDGDGDYDQLYMMGTRSFSIWNSQGVQVFDSGSQLQRHVIDKIGKQNFNTRVDDTNDAEDIAKLVEKGTLLTMRGETAYFFEGQDARSEKKGIEPEALALGKIGDTTYAFIGLEKQGGFMIYDISNPVDPRFVEYHNLIDYTKSPANAGDLGPEGMVFVPADKSPNGKNLLVVANEVSGTTSFYEISGAQ